MKNTWQTFLKKAAAICLLAALMAACLPAAAEEAPITVFVDGEQVVFDQEPVIVNDRTMVPMRAIFESLGAVVEWDADSRTAYARRRFDELFIVIGSDQLYRNDEVIALDAPAELIGDRTMVPVRAVSEAFDLLVQWDAAARRVTVESQPEALKVSDRYITDTVTTDSGAALLTVTSAYPEIDNPDGNTAVAAINAAAKAEAEAYLAETKETAGASAQASYDSYAELGLSFTPYTYNRMFDVTYGENGFFAVAYKMTEMFGLDVSASQTLDGRVYSLESGEAVSPAVMMDMDEEGLRALAIEQLLALVQASPAEYQETAEEYLAADDIPLVVLPTAYGMAFMAQPGTITLDVRGIACAVMPYREHADRFVMDYTTQGTPEALAYLLRKEAGSARGWGAEVSLVAEGDVTVDGTACTAFAAAQGDAELGRFAVAKDLSQVYEYDAAQAAYRAI